MRITKLNIQDTLPLTCSRSGTCCHGNQVLLNPWELFRIATEKKISPSLFRDLYCDFGGIQLQFNGKVDARNKPACSQYSEGFGCSVHVGRPLACRLFPLGRHIQNDEVHYIYQGEQFPCLNGCTEVLELPILSVENYLKGQQTEQFEKAQDGYLEVMQNLADLAFELLLDTGLAESGDTKTVQLWREMGNESPAELAKRIGIEWMDYLMIPPISNDSGDSIHFIEEHQHLLLSKAQDKIGVSQTNQAFHEASVLIMGVALHLARSIGANPTILAELWCETARNHGAQG